MRNQSRRMGAAGVFWLLLAAGCSSGNYAGQVAPEPGQPARCGAASRGVLTIEKRHFVFAPREGVLTIAGRMEPDGRLHGTGESVVRPTKPSASNPGLSNRGPIVAHRQLSQPTVFDAQLSGTEIQGRMSRDGCNFTVSLQGK